MRTSIAVQVLMNLLKGAVMNGMTPRAPLTKFDRNRQRPPGKVLRLGIFDNS